MQQILSVWRTLDMRKRIIVGLATLAMFAAVLTLANIAARPSMALLYAGLESSSAGEVIAALETRGATYEVRGDSIFVESTRRDELRMTLASDGLPTNSAQGYELLDSLTGFGTTSQMFDAAYWRAKEGELARTIMSSPRIRSARVHIATPSPQSFRKNNAPTASVTVITADGSFTADHAKGLKYLVASAVPGLAPESVSVIDGRSGLVFSGDEAERLAGDNGDREAELRQNVERLLEARVGMGNAVVEVSLETATEQESIVERSFDPDSRVAISTETTETSNASNGSLTGGVSVASNLPTGDTGGGSESSEQASETRERINYEVSETTREILREPGTLKRISVAVLVDGIRGVDEAGNPKWTPRPEEELAALRELVASAVGFNEERGDIITIKSLEFEQIASIDSNESTGFLAGLKLDVMSLIQLVVLAAVSLVLGLFVLRPALSGQMAAALPQGDGKPVGSLPGPADPTVPDETLADLPALTGEIADDGIEMPEMAMVSDFDLGDGEHLSLPALGGDSADPVERLRALIEERQEETVEILRGWMEEPEEAG